MARILVVEDSNFSRQMIAKILKIGGYDVLEANSVSDGLEKLVKEKPDCILLDLLMPEMNGCEFLVALNEKGLTIPTIILSADIQETTRKKCSELGASDFITKPPKEEVLLTAVQQVIDSKVRC